MKVLVLGGTGFIGRHVVEGLIANNDEVIVLSRNAQKGFKIFGSKVKVVEGDPSQAGDWQKEVATADAVIVLLGEPIIDKKWTSERKKLLIDSRIIPTKLVTEAMAGSAENPKVLICGSAIGIYGDRADEELVEESSPGEGFSAKLCKAWEEQANEAKELGVRVVNLRTSFVLAKDGGGLVKMAKPFKFFVGGPMGSGRQFISWIHVDDYVNIVLMALENSEVNGPLNMSSPNPLINKEFSKALGRAMKRPSFLKVPASTLHLILGEASSLLLESQRVLPKKAQKAGYSFKYQKIDDALSDLFR